MFIKVRKWPNLCSIKTYDTWKVGQTVLSWSTSFRLVEKFRNGWLVIWSIFGAWRGTLILKTSH